MARSRARQADLTASAPPAVGDRRPPVAAEGARAELDARRRLAALVLGAVDERERPADDLRVELLPRAPRASGRARRTPRARGSRSSYGGSDWSSRWSARSSALGGRSIVVTGISSRPARSFRWRESRKTSSLEHVLEEREPADHVAVDRRVADGHLRLVPRRDHEPAVRVRERHQASSPRIRAWRFSAARPSSPPSASW